MSEENKIKAVVVLSGGQDSAICLKLACKKYGSEHVAAITFNYGQRHAIETKYAKCLAKFFNIAEHKIIKLDFYRHLTRNSLMNDDIPIEKKKGAKCPTTVVEGRNAFFLLSAGVWAKSLGAKVLYTGVSQADYSGYPDCRNEFIRAQEKAMRLAMMWPFKIETPFMKMTKSGEWELADKLGIMDLIRNNTVTCYRGVPGDGCGECPSCKLRNNGLAEYLEKKANKSNKKRK